MIPVMLHSPLRRVVLSTICTTMFSSSTFHAHVLYKFYLPSVSACIGGRHGSRMSIAASDHVRGVSYCLHSLYHSVQKSNVICRLQMSFKLDGPVLSIMNSVKGRCADREQSPSNHLTMRFSCCGQNARDSAIAGLHFNSHPLNLRLQSISCVHLPFSLPACLKEDVRDDRW
jgi:hypothetical protein